MTSKKGIGGYGKCSKSRPLRPEGVIVYMNQVVNEKGVAPTGVFGRARRKFPFFRAGGAT